METSVNGSGHRPVLHRSLDSGAEIFSGNDTVKTYEARLSELERLLGQKEVELALLKKNLGSR